MHILLDGGLKKLKQHNIYLQIKVYFIQSKGFVSIDSINWVLVLQGGTKTIKYFNGLCILKCPWASCKMKAIIEKEITLVNSYNLDLVFFNWGKTTCTIQNLRHVMPIFISNKYFTIFCQGIKQIPHKSQQIGHYATCSLKNLLENFIGH